MDHNLFISCVWESSNYLVKNRKTISWLFINHRKKDRERIVWNGIGQKETGGNSSRTRSIDNQFMIEKGGIQWNSL